MNGLPDAIANLMGAGAETRIAVVGASRDPSKYGNVIVKDLQRRGYTVRPVNPKETEIEGLRCHATVDAAGPVDIVSFVAPPKATLSVLKTLDPARHAVVWFQPGAFDDACLAFARGRFAHVVEGDCIMVVARWFA